MPFSITHGQDYQDDWGRHVANHYLLNPSSSDYATGGYPLQGSSGTPVSADNISMTKIGYVLPVGGQGGYVPVWNPVTQKLQIFQGANGLGPDTEVPASTDLSAYQFNLLIVGY